MEEQIIAMLGDICGADPGEIQPDTALFDEGILDSFGLVQLIVALEEAFGRENIVRPEAAACGELIYDILAQLGPITAELALPLYVAVSTDTGCFVYSNTTPHTHRVAAGLMEQGIDFKRLNKKHFRTKSVARMRLESLLLQGLYLCHDNTVAVATLSLDVMAKAGATNDDTEDIAAFVGQLEGLRHSATIRELKPGECKISMRTNADYLDACAVCAHLGGGGHKAAAGCTVMGSVEEAKAAILQAIDQELNRK